MRKIKKIVGIVIIIMMIILILIPQGSYAKVYNLDKTILEEIKKMSKSDIQESLNDMSKKRKLR